MKFLLLFILFFSTFSVPFAIGKINTPFAEMPGISKDDLPQALRNSKNYSLIQEKIRMQSFTEYMSPAFSKGQGSIPYENGKPLSASNAFHFIWIDYEIATNTRILYWQRVNVFMPSAFQGNNFQWSIRNPRFAFRKLNIWNTNKITTTYDFYIQPGFAAEARPDQMGRSLEFGIRTSHSYSFENSHWSIGLTSETTKVFSFNGDPVVKAYGWILPWAIYAISSRFSTQHYLTLSLQQFSKDPWNKISYDYPMPLVTQNGIGYLFSNSFSLSLLINNYLIAPPTLQNTWVSLWVMLTFLE